MIKKIKATFFEKLILLFVILLGIFVLSFTIFIKNKCLFVKKYDAQKIDFGNPENIAVLNTECGNVIIELYPNISPNAVIRFKKLINSKAYDNVAFHRVIKDKLVQAGDLEFGKKGKLDYRKIGTGKSGLGTIKSEIEIKFLLVISILMIGFNVFQINWTAPNWNENIIALIGIISASCALILILILLISNKISEKNKK